MKSIQWEQRQITELFTSKFQLLQSGKALEELGGICSERFHQARTPNGELLQEGESTGGCEQVAE
jgi:hypothetical protein